MKYRFLLRFLRSLVYVKRLFWWVGGALQAGLFLVIKTLVWRPVLYLQYKGKVVLKQLGFGRLSEVGMSRTALQTGLFALLAVIALPETKLYQVKDLLQPGQKSLAYALTSSESDEASLDDIAIETAAPEVIFQPVPSWRGQALNADDLAQNSTVFFDQEFYGSMAGGMALSNPVIAPGATLAGSKRTKTENYVVEAGDSLSSIAYQFGISVATVLWENDLTLRSLLKPGQILSIPPVTGVRHTIKRGDTLLKIASRYEVKPDVIISFNKLKDDGTDLIIGETIMVPDGIRPEERAVAAIARNSQSARTVATPAASRQSPTGRGFVWPSGVRIITQYFGWRHNALDIAGPFATPSYAAKAGTVEKAQCGWNGGYGCYVIINHGDGIRTLYAHHSRLLVSPGDHVETGQTIALMGNTGNVRGHTGIHLHFEVIVNGVRVNPLGYVR